MAFSDSSIQFMTYSTFVNEKVLIAVSEHTIAVADDANWISTLNGNAVHSNNGKYFGHRVPTILISG